MASVANANLYLRTSEREKLYAVLRDPSSPRSQSGWSLLVGEMSGSSVPPSSRESWTSLTRMHRNTSRPARCPCATTTAAGSVPASINCRAFSWILQRPALGKVVPADPQMGPHLGLVGVVVRESMRGRSHIRVGPQLPVEGIDQGILERLDRQLNQALNTNRSFHDGTCQGSPIIAKG